MKTCTTPLLVLLLCLASGCGGEPGSDGRPAGTPTLQPEDLSLCTAPPTIRISDIESVVAWINAMPRPLSLACFIASLPRPIHYNATDSTFSLQPAVGQHNPRIFINYGKLWLSFVPQEPLSIKEDKITGETFHVWDADGIQLLEFGLEVESNRLDQQTIKGELTFPVLHELPPNAAYDRIVKNGAGVESTCRGCHGSETIVGSLDGVPIFRSRMIRSTRSSEVGHAYLIHQYLNCDPEVNTGGGPENNEWYRCQMFDAFFGKGSMVWSSFPEETTVFVQE